MKHHPAHRPFDPNQVLAIRTSDNFVRGFVAAGCLSAFQNNGLPKTQADVMRALRFALQGGAALAAGSYAATALRQRCYAGAALATIAGAAGVLLTEYALNSTEQTSKEKKRG